MTNSAGNSGYPINGETADDVRVTRGPERLPTPEDVAQPRDLQPEAQANASTDPSMPASMGAATAGAALGPTTMGQSRPPGPQPGSATANRTGEVGTPSAISRGNSANTHARPSSGATTAEELDQRNVPGGSGPTNAEAGDVGLPSVSGAPHTPKP